jgi:putative nucleotidyltransferase with HDIG domain
MPRSVEELAKGAAGIPSLPQIYGQLTEALDNPRASTGQIADIISGDSGLAARLLRLVNSAFYCFPSKVESISHAVLLVGTEQIRDLALATSILRSFKGISADLVDMESFWLHSVATGVTARVLATHRREANSELFFVAGVLHDIGRLLMYKSFPDEAREALSRARHRAGPLLEMEREVFGFDHAAAGGVVLHAWGLPPSLTEMVRCHHTPADARRYPVEAAVVHVADVIVTALELGNGGDEAVPRLSPTAWKCLALPESVLGVVAEQVERQVDDVRRSVLAGA